MDLFQKAKAFLFARKHAYRMLFDKENVYLESVLKDLAKFCRANKTTFHTDARLSAVLEGRREVWLRISNHLNLSEDDLWKIYGENQE